MHHKLSQSGLAIALAATWGILVVLSGLLAHFTDIGQTFYKEMTHLYPILSSGPQGILIMLIFAILHGLITGVMIASFYNAYLSAKSAP